MACSSRPEMHPLLWGTLGVTDAHLGIQGAQHREPLPETAAGRAGHPQPCDGSSVGGGTRHSDGTSSPGLGLSQAFLARAKPGPRGLELWGVWILVGSLHPGLDRWKMREA